MTKQRIFKIARSQPKVPVMGASKDFVVPLSAFELDNAAPSPECINEVVDLLVT